VSTALLWAICSSHVLGVRLADDARGDAQHHVAVAVHELLEGPQVSGQRRAHELLVRRRHQTRKDGMEPRRVTGSEVME
jgi:hypothetical protein